MSRIKNGPATNVASPMRPKLLFFNFLAQKSKKDREILLRMIIKIHASNVLQQSLLQHSQGKI